MDAFHDHDQALPLSAQAEGEVSETDNTGAPKTPFDDLAPFVRRNMEQRISVTHLATLCGMSRTNFNRVFRGATGTSPYRWVMEMRVGRAKQLLRQGMPFAQVASATGFTDQAHFNRMFKAATGRAPGIWLKDQRSCQFGPILQDADT